MQIRQLRADLLSADHQTMVKAEIEIVDRLSEILGEGASVSKETP